MLVAQHLHIGNSRCKLLTWAAVEHVNASEGADGQNVSDSLI